MRIVGVIIIIAALASGCAGLSRQACFDMDWRAVGYADGVRGAQEEAASPQLRSCAKKEAVAFDNAAYLAGWREGLQVYCTPANGYTIGHRGEETGGVCKEAVEMAVDFEAAYAKGRRAFDLESAVEAADRRISGAESELWDIKLRLAEVDAVLASLAMTNDERKDKLAERDFLRKESRRIERAIASLKMGKMTAEADLAAFEDASAGDLSPRGVTQPISVSY